jgi:hypothetical protein
MGLNIIQKPPNTYKIVDETSVLTDFSDFEHLIYRISAA